LGIPFFSDDEIEENLRMVRRKLFDDLENGCYFEVGRRLQESAFEQYEVTDILRQGEHETFITVKTIGRWGDGSERTMTEEELFTRCCTGYHLKDEKVDMRRNLFVISGPSGVGKDEVVKAFIEKYPGIKKAVSVTTRRKRSDETEGVDYYYITKEAFSDHRINKRLVEFELFDGDYYGTLYSEIERHPEDEPLVLVVDVRGRRSIIKRYPLAKSIFISPPTDEMLVKRIISKYKNAPGEMTHRLTVAKEELEQACMYDHLVVNEDMDTCVRKIFQIVAANNGKQHREES
jgi:guanylate kinase